MRGLCRRPGWDGWLQKGETNFGNARRLEWQRIPISLGMEFFVGLSDRRRARFLIVLVGMAGSLAAAVGQSSDAKGRAPLSAEQAKILQAARLYALAYISTLPDFICTQVTDRDTTKTGAVIAQDGSFGVGSLTPKSEPGHGPSDQIVEKLTYFSQKENYEVVTVNGKKVAGVEHAKLAGATSAGEFGTAMSAVFDPHSRTAFWWRRPASVRGRKAYVFGFQVPKEAGIKISARNAGQDIVAPYHGQVFVDAETEEVLRITTEFDLPKDFPIETADRVVEYRRTDVAGKRYVLPFHSEVSMESAGQKFLNKIEFKDFHKFAVESTLMLGGPEEARITEAVPDPVRAGWSGGGIPDAAKSPEAGAAVAAPVQGGGGAETTTPGSGAPAAVANAEPNRAPESAAAAVPAEKEPFARTARSTSEGGGAADGGAPNAAPAGPAPDAGAGSPFVLHMNTDLVLVPVVVRDRNGNPMAHLGRDNFQVFDKGKRQEIVDFTVVAMGDGGALDSHMAAAGPQGYGGEVAAAVGSGTSNYIVYLFDDLHLTGADMTRAKDAAVRSFEALTAADRAAIISTSGEVTTTLTTDREKLKEAVAKLRVQPGEGGGGCPPITYYMANEMVSETGPGTAARVATIETIGCMNLKPEQASYAAQMAHRTAESVAAVGERQSRGSLLQLRAVVRWLAKAPGNRRILLVSPGFVLNNVALMDSGNLVDEAIRNQVVISALDVRGVHGADASGGVDEKGYDAGISRDKAALATQEITATEGGIGGIAEGTGGTFIRNSNDLDGGLKRLVAAPVCTYVLAFKPAHLKADGAYHALEVKLEGGEKGSVQARPGYFAPRQ
jgi:VWFA-related protein